MINPLSCKDFGGIRLLSLFAVGNLEIALRILSDSSSKEPHWDRLVFVCVRSALQNVHKQSKFYPILAALPMRTAG